jgi:GTP-sensing pleiotropic transcriptional regulator CodY
MISVIAENPIATYLAYASLAPPMNKATMAPIKGSRIRLESIILISETSQ